MDTGMPVAPYPLHTKICPVKTVEFDVTSRTSFVNKANAVIAHIFQIFKQSFEVCFHDFCSIWHRTRGRPSCVAVSVISKLCLNGCVADLWGAAAQQMVLWRTLHHHGKCEMLAAGCQDQLRDFFPHLHASGFQAVTRIPLSSSCGPPW